MSSPLSHPRTRKVQKGRVCSHALLGGASVWSEPARPLPWQAKSARRRSLTHDLEGRMSVVRQGLLIGGWVQDVAVGIRLMCGLKLPRILPGLLVQPALA